MDYNLLKILFAILCFQLLFVSVFLFQSKKGKSISNKLLALIFFMMSVSVINLFGLIFRIKTGFPQILFIDDTFMFAYGPLLYFFTQSVVFEKYKLTRKSVVHLVPFAISLCLVAATIIFADTESVLAATKQLAEQEVPVYIRMGEMLILLSILLYLFRSKAIVHKVLHKVYETYSAVDPNRYKLLNFILNCFIILFLLSILHSILPFLGFEKSLLITLLLLVLFMFYFINSVLFKILNQSGKNSGLISQSSFESKEKYAGSSLTEAQIAESKSRIWDYMQSEKRYLDSELNIDDLANDLGLSSKIISQVINAGFSCNFFDFVNKMRVEEAKSLFSNQIDDRMTIQEVMYNSGFNSKSSFNTAFKKFSHLTPTQFKENLKKMGSTS